MLNSTFTMLIFFGAIVASQIIGRKALNALTSEQKLALMESSSKVPWSLIVIAVVYGIQIFISDQFGYSIELTGGFMLVLFCVILISYFLMFRRFQNLGLPPSYIRTSMISQSVVLLALLFMLWSNYTTMSEMNDRTEKLLNPVIKRH